VLTEAVEREVVAGLRLDENPFAAGQRGFFEVGVDSFTGIEITNRLHTLLGIELPATLLLEHPTPERVADHLLALLYGDDRPPHHTARPEAPLPRGFDDPMALIEAEYDALRGAAQ
jgi:acyl carrier protein